MAHQETMKNQFQIIIPMSGFGERFRRAGYNVPKPLINVEGKPIISHVIDLFPGEKNLHFICNEDHLNNSKFKMKEILSEIAPEAKIHAIEPHKLGPVHAISKIYDYINDDLPTIINYCDFTCYWDWSQVKDKMLHPSIDGCIPAYKGFHPHSLGNTNYAYMKTQNDTVLDIQEKQPYTKNRMQEYASSGTYYFKNGMLLKKSCEFIFEENHNTNGEFYASMLYKYLFARKKNVSVIELEHFMQWGTPQDLNEYNYWSDAFKKIDKKQNTKKNLNDILLIPAAGEGSRFKDQGYKEIKPRIKVSGETMLIGAVSDLPKANDYIFVLRKDIDEMSDIEYEIKSFNKRSKIHLLDGLTDGQAVTILEGLKKIKKEDFNKSITVGTCDNGVIFNSEKLSNIFQSRDCDVILWGIRGYPNAAKYPQQYGWIEESNNNNVKKVSVKTPLENPESDSIVIGTFTFKKVSDLKTCIEHLISSNKRVNGEFYMDSAINSAIELGLSVKHFEVDSFLCWGTPNDLKTYEYWEKCFSKWNSHPFKKGDH